MTGNWLIKCQCPQCAKVPGMTEVAALRGRVRLAENELAAARGALAKALVGAHEVKRGDLVYNAEGVEARVTHVYVQDDGVVLYGAPVGRAGTTGGDFRLTGAWEKR